MAVFWAKCIGVLGGVCLLAGDRAHRRVVRYYSLDGAALCLLPVRPGIGREHRCRADDRDRRPSIDHRNSWCAARVQRVNVLEEDRWVGTPKREIPRVLAANLSTLLPTVQIAPYPQQATAAATWQILLDVQSFDAQPGEAVTVELVWTLRRQSDGQPSDLAHQRQRAPGRRQPEGHRGGVEQGAWASG